MMKFRNLLNISLLSLALITLFAACKKDENAVVPTQEEAIFSPNNGMQQMVTSRNSEDDILCFEVNFPLTVQLPDGSSLSAGNMEELETIYTNWVNQNPGDTTCPAIAYPISVTLEDGSVQTLNSDEDIIELMETCFDEEIGWEDCFTIDYPVTVQYPDGTSATANNDGELMQLFDDWYNANPNSMEDPTVVYPINITLADGSNQSVGSDEEIEQVFEDCYGEWEDTTFVECFEFVFPVQVALPDGSILTANNNEELDAIYMDWFEANPQAVEFPAMVFPMQVVLLETGETLTLNDEEDLAAVLESCYGGGIDYEPCFTYNYPLTLVMPDGSTYPVNSDEAMAAALEDWFTANPNSPAYITFQFPFSVTLLADGSVVTVNNEMELSALYQACYGCLVDGGSFTVAQVQNTAAQLVVKRHTAVEKQAKSRISKAFSGKMKLQAR